MKIIGADPGKSGCIVVVDSYTLKILSSHTIASSVDSSGEVSAGMFCYSPDKILDLAELATTVEYSFVEIPQSRFGNSAKSSLIFGVGYGFLVSALLSTPDTNTVLIHAQTWKAGLSLRKSDTESMTTKKISKEFAKLMCPNWDESVKARPKISEISGLADAFCIAYYGIQSIKGDTK